MTSLAFGRGRHWLGRPSVLPWKLGRWLRLQRASRAYRSALAGGDASLLVEAGPLPTAGLISVVMPVFRVAERHLRAAIASVRAQSWPHWELLIVDDASPDPHVARVLAEAAADPRVHVTRRSANGGISAASDDGVAAARGEYVAFLDHDDALHPRALELVTRFLAAHPDTDWLYTDEDKIDGRGRHADPILKPGWSRHLLLGCNVASHLRVVRRGAIARAGGHRRGLEGAQDYDLALRVLATGGRFAHLPGPLYHWRTVPRSMARVAGAKPDANARALAALAEYARTFPRGGAVTAEVIAPGASLFRVRRAPDPALRLAVAAPAGTALELPAGSPVALVSPAAASPAALVAAARGCHADVLAVAPPGGFGAGQLEELLSLLQVPGTAAAGGQLVAGRRIAASGWELDGGGAPLDRWRGLHVSDPGEGNFALLPSRRLALPPSGWAAWRAEAVAAWDAAAEVPEPWRLAAGWHRLGLEVVTTPDARFPVHGAGPWPPAGTPPRDLLQTLASPLALAGRLP